MDETTKKAAVDKAKAIATHKIFPNDPIIKTKLHNYYESMTLNESEFFLNFLRLNKLDLDYNFRQLHEPVDKDDWLRYPMRIAIGAFYNVFQNKIRKCKCGISHQFYVDFYIFNSIDSCPSSDTSRAISGNILFR